jgi:hypothetical protein
MKVQVEFGDRVPSFVAIEQPLGLSPNSLGFRTSLNGLYWITKGFLAYNSFFIRLGKNENV